MDWKLKEWNEYFADKAGVKLEPMTDDEIESGISQLRDSNYPKPTDCPEGECPKHRPACTLGICQVAVGMCGDF